MVVATEELSRGSLGIGGSLITRPEILTRALLKGGTEAQKHEWLPKLATAEVMAAVAVTEPDFGSDVAGIKVTATPANGPGDEPGYVINGVRRGHIAARADVLMLLAHRCQSAPVPPQVSCGISVPKPRATATGSSSPIASNGTIGKMEVCNRHHRISRECQLRDRLRQLWVRPQLIGEATGWARVHFQMEKLREQASADRTAIRS
jgi:(2S)-methylsuccinyl-CoA dehydrogenase